MRPIKYRGWNPKNERWIYGYYLQNRGKHFVCEDEFAADGQSWDDYEVVPESVGQFTGICESGSYQDSQPDTEQDGGRMVYEGDIIEVNGDYQKPLVVVFYECMFCLATVREYDHLQHGSHPFLNDYAHLPVLGDYPMQGEVKVIGNVFDNPRMDLTTEDGTRRVVIIGEQEMLARTAEYSQMFDGDAITTPEIIAALSEVPDTPEFTCEGFEFGYGVSPQWPEKCHCFRTIFYNEHVAVFRYYLGKV